MKVKFLIEYKNDFSASILEINTASIMDTIEIIKNMANVEKVTLML